MGKNKNQRKGTKVDDNTDDDTLSTTSTGSSMDFGGAEVEEEQDEGTILDGFLEALYEKRASTRETGLRGLIGALTSNVLVDFVDEKYETLLHLFLGSVKRGSSTEKALAARAIGLLALTAGPGDIASQIMTDSWPHLVKVAKTDGSPFARISALDTMAVVPFVGDTELETTENAMATLWQICSHKGNYHSDQVMGTNRPSGSVKAAAVLSWALLLSTVPTARIASHHVALSLPTLSSLLKDDDLSVRTAAGEAVALLYDATKDGFEESPFQSDDDTSQNPALAIARPQPTHKLAASAGKELEAKEVEVVAQMKALSVQSGGKGQSKKERYAQRASFKDLLTNIEDGVCREISVKLQGGDVLRINTWTHTIQLNALRRVLVEGFQRHLQENVLLHEIFQFQPRLKRQTMSTKEKRLYMSPNSVISKARTQTRNLHRSISQAGNEGHYNVNSDDT